MKVKLHHYAKFHQNRSISGRDFAIFRFFKMAAAAILDFRNFKFLTVGTVKRVELRHRAKFNQNRSNRGRDMTFLDFQDGGRRHLGFSKFQIFNGRTRHEWRTASLCQISSKSLKTRPSYVSFNIMLVWLENDYSRSLLGVFGAHFPQIVSLIVLTTKRTILGLNHVIWAINREHRSCGSSWALVREKNDRIAQDRKKVTNGLYFTYLWWSPHWSNVHENLCSGCCSRRNHVCQVSKWNFQGLRFYRGSNFLFFFIDFEWALQQCSATALPVITQQLSNLYSF